MQERVQRKCRQIRKPFQYKKGISFALKSIPNFNKKKLRVSWSTRLCLLYQDNRQAQIIRVYRGFTASLKKPKKKKPKVTIVQRLPQFVNRTDVQGFKQTRKNIGIPNIGLTWLPPATKDPIVRPW